MTIDCPDQQVGCVCVCTGELYPHTHTRVLKEFHCLPVGPTCNLPQISVKKSGSDDRRKNQVYREREREREDDVIRLKDLLSFGRGGVAPYCPLVFAQDFFPTERKTVSPF